MKPCKLLEPETINGKPFGGVFYGSYKFLPAYLPNDVPKSKDDPILISHLNELKKSILSSYPDCQSRHLQVVYRPQRLDIGSPGILAIKYLLWGRAYQVLKKNKKKAKRFRKIIVSGRRKRVRI